jgi:hypothetical protein
MGPGSDVPGRRAAATGVFGRAAGNAGWIHARFARFQPPLFPIGRLAIAAITPENQSAPAATVGHRARWIGRPGERT